MKNSELMDQMLFFDLCDDEVDDAVEKNDWECQECGENLLVNDNYKVCPNCGLCADKEFVQVFADRPMTCIRKSMYKQINHFKHILNTVQNRETKTVPDDIYYILESHIENLEVNLENIRKCLKDMKQSKYYKHCVQLYCKLKGITVFKCLSPDEEQSLTQLFIISQTAYKELENNKRKNFLNYNFVARKLLSLINRDDLSDLCKPLKNAALRTHNRLWSQICDRREVLYHGYNI